MKLPFIPNLSSPLAKRLVNVVLSLYFVIALSLTVVQLVHEFRQEKAWLDADIQATVENFELVLAEALWNFDDVQIAKSAKSILKQKSILGIEILDGDEAVMSSAGNIVGDDGKVIVTNETLLKENGFLGGRFASQYIYEFSVMHGADDEAVSVGVVKVYSNSDIVVLRALSTFLVTIINAIIKTLFLWLIFVFVLQKHVAKPLEKLTHSVRELNPSLKSNAGQEQPETSIGIKQDELSELSTNFDELSLSLRKKNQQLIEHQTELEQKVADRTQELERLSKEKSLFLANMSHEIRTPMNGVLGMIELLQDTKLDETQSSHLGFVYRSGQSLLTIINNILDYTKIESNKLDLEKIIFSLKSVVNDSITLASIKAKEQGLKLEMNLADTVPDLIRGDPTRLGQIINNLLNNAIKFTDEGLISLRIENIGPDGDDEVRLKFHVQDSGIGLSEEQIQNLFQAFTQADSTITRKYGGTGLGLTICKHIVEAMGGGISVSSKPGEGSTFSFEVKAELVDLKTYDHSEDDRLSQIANLSSFRALLFDVDDEFYSTADNFSHSRHIRLQRTSSIDELIRDIRKAEEETDPFHVVWLRWQGSTRDTEILLKSIHSQIGEFCPPFIVNCPIHSLDAHEKLEGCGVLAMIEEPVSSPSVQEAFMAIHHHDRERKRSPLLLQSLAELKVLIAEDNPINKAVITGMLKKMYIEAEVVSNGALAVHKVKQCSTPYDVVFMDCEMPILDGWKATEKIREYETSRNVTDTVQIVGLSAHALQEHRTHSLRSGMDKHLTKPVNLNKLYALLSEIAAAKLRKEDKDQAHGGAAS